MKNVNSTLMFSQLTVKGVSFKNRIVLPPMCQYTATEDGYATAYHTVHYGSKALGGAGLVILEATPVSPNGRISGNDIGIWEDGQIEGLKTIAEHISSFGAVPGIQLGHAGRKAWPGVARAEAPSATPFSPERLTPHALTTDEVKELIADFTRAASRAIKAGFKVLELHGAHGYLIQQFLSPLSNHRTDEFGGTPENRMRFAVDIVKSIQQFLPEDVLLTIRLSGTEYSEQGYTLEELVSCAKVLKAAGIDMIHVSTGGGSTTPPPVWPGYQLKYAQVIKEEVDIPVIGVGLLTAELGEFALREGYCDFVAIGRGHLENPNWAWDASLRLNETPAIPDNLKRFFIKQ